MTKKRRVYVAMPTYERHENEMMTAVYKHAIPPEKLDLYLPPDVTLDESLKVDSADVGCLVANPSKGESLLAKAFNDHWCRCLNEPIGFTHWHLQHGDVHPEGYFVDELIEEMEKHDLDVIHACVAIKDGRGVTSTAIGPISATKGDFPGSTFATCRKITTRELERLPETFTVEDCLEHLDWSGEHPFKQLMKESPINLCMLPNTGCMMVRLGDWAYQFPGFMIMDRLVMELEDGVHQRPCVVQSPWGPHLQLPKDRDKRRMTQTVPEDWNFGKWCARQGLKVGATTKVVTNHWGLARFTCKRGSGWGDEHRDAWFFGSPKVTQTMLTEK